MLRAPVAAIVMILAGSPAWAQGVYQGAIVIDGTGNAVLEPNETVEVRPSWGNAGFITFCTAAGTLGSFMGPVGPTYSILDGSGSYGCLFAQSPPVFCSDCYAVRIDAGARPATHWDASILEGPLGIQAPWTLHVGATFTDVPTTSPFYRFVEAIAHKDVTGGCSATAYCPSASTTRDQMAVFVLVSKEPAGYLPPACGAVPMFADVPVTSPFCRWVEELARRGVVGGCGGSNYCPTSPATREQMAVFVLRTLDPALNPPACGTPVSPTSPPPARSAGGSKSWSGAA